MEEIRESAPSIPEMQAMLQRPVGVDFHPLVTKHSICIKCGSEKSDWWLIQNGERYCRKCATTSSS